MGLKEIEIVPLRPNIPRAAEDAHKAILDGGPLRRLRWMSACGPQRGDVRGGPGAVELGKPLIERVLTVTGSGIREPKISSSGSGLLCRGIGQCGGLTEDRPSHHVRP
jgi:hypothetical protein